MLKPLEHSFLFHAGVIAPLWDDPGMITQGDLQHWFTHHPPTESQVAQYARLRAEAKRFAEAIVAETIPGTSQDAAVMKIREAVMLANASIACGGR